MGVVGVVRLLRTDIVVQGGAASFITVSSVALGRTSLVTRTSIPTVCCIGYDVPPTKKSHAHANIRAQMCIDVTASMETLILLCPASGTPNSLLFPKLWCRSSSLSHSLTHSLPPSHCSHIPLRRIPETDNSRQRIFPPSGRLPAALEQPSSSPLPSLLIPRFQGKLYSGIYR